MDQATEPTSPDAEFELVRRAQTGDELAFGELMQTNYQTVFRLVFAIIRHEADAKEVCQDVWVTVWKNLNKFRGEAKFTTWVHPVAVRRSIDYLRKKQSWFDRFLPFSSGPNKSNTEVAEPIAPSDPRRETETAESDEAFESALATLPPKLRAALALREVQGLSYDEIARVLRCRPGTATSRIFNARRLIAKKLGDLS